MFGEGWLFACIPSVGPPLPPFDSGPFRGVPICADRPGCYIRNAMSHPIKGSPSRISHPSWSGHPHAVESIYTASDRA